MRTFVALASAILLTVSVSHAQAPSSSARGSSNSAPRTPWGDPDLQGTYTNRNESYLRNMLKVARDAEKKPS